MEAIYRVNSKLVSDLCSSSVLEETTELGVDMVVETVCQSLEETRKITILVPIEEVDLIENIIEILSFNDFHSDPLIRLIVVAKLSTWRGTIFNASAHTLLDVFHQRTPCHDQFELWALENMLQTIDRSGKGRVKLAYVGELFGGKGYDHHTLFRSGWENCVPKVPPRYKNAVVPVAHIDHACVLLNNLLRDDSGSFINFLFDLHSISLENFMDNFVEKSGSSYTIDDTDHTDDVYGKLLEKSVSIDWLRGLQDLETSLPHPILNSFATVWNEFVHSNGLSPIHVAVIGPPKSGKTNLSKVVSTILEIPHVDTTSSVAFVFNYSAQAYPEDLCDDYLEASRSKILSALEQKFTEGLAGKKGKDKAPVDSKLDTASITDAFCSTLSPDILLESVAFRSFLDPLCRKRGYVLDCWEKDIFAAGQTAAFQNCTKQSFATPCRLVIQRNMEKQKILDKQLEIMGPQGAKSKEGQALLKSLEATLDSYFQCLKPDSDGRLVDPTVLRWIEAEPLTIFEAGADMEDPTIIMKSLLPIVKKAFGFIPGWIHFQEDVEQNFLNSFGAENEGAPTYIKETDSSHISSGLEQSDQCVQKYTDFLSATVMGILAKGLVSVTRENSKDPIKELANILYEASNQNQKNSYDNAKIAFEKLLQTS